MCWPDHHYDYENVNDDYDDLNDDYDAVNDDYDDVNDDYDDVNDEDKEAGYQNILDNIETTIVHKRAAITTSGDNLEEKKLFELSKYKSFSMNDVWYL